MVSFHRETTEFNLSKMSQEPTHCLFRAQSPFLISKIIYDSQYWTRLILCKTFDADVLILDFFEIFKTFLTILGCEKPQNTSNTDPKVHFNLSKRIENEENQYFGLKNDHFLVRKIENQNVWFEAPISALALKTYFLEREIMN